MTVVTQTRTGTKIRLLWKIVAFCICAIVASSQMAVALGQQYKKHNRNGIELIADGKYDRAIHAFQAQIRHHEKNRTQHHDVYPVDCEALFGLAVAHAHKGQTSKALGHARRAINNGLPPRRFLSGPRHLLKPLVEIRQFRSLPADHDIQLLHGPMLSDVTDSKAEFWVRTVREVPVQIRVSRSPQMEGIIASAKERTEKNRDYTAVVTVSDLQPDTKYFYRVIVNGQPIEDCPSFCTYPAAGQPAQFRVGFGGGAGYTPWHEHTWNTIAEHNLPAFLLLGDNVYIDHPKYPAVQKYCYYRRQCRPEYRKFSAQTSIYAIWDDHDFTTNDSGGGPAIMKPSWKIPVWNVFRNNWNNPYYGEGEAQPGCWFDFRIADVHFIMLDGRFYRTTSDVEHPTMLGPVQKQWLFDTLKQSEATFKVIASPVPWSYGSKPGSDDPWQGYREEREEIFSFIGRENIAGVILIAADRHRSDIWKINRDGSYDLYEFESSKLTNLHTHRIMSGCMYGYNDRCSFGILEFDTARANPRVSYQIWNIDNELVYQRSLPRVLLQD